VSGKHILQSQGRKKHTHMFSEYERLPEAYEVQDIVGEGGTAVSSKTCSNLILE
jgi:hypothetical protein